MTVNRFLPVKNRERLDWREPELAAGRGRAIALVAALMILIGAATDTVAFKSVLDLLLNEASWLSAMMAIGATMLSLVAAATVGIALASVRRKTGSVAIAVVMTLMWLAMGIVLFVVRWHAAQFGATPAGFGFSDNSADLEAVRDHYRAWFFFALYLLSGLCAMFEAYRLQNPVHGAYRRLSKQLSSKVAETIDLEARKALADAVVEHYEKEYDREDSRLRAAVAERQALGAELANYARHLMAVRLQDPAKTGISETGPAPVPPTPLLRSAPDDSTDNLRRPA